MKKLIFVVLFLGFYSIACKQISTKPKYVQSPAKKGPIADTDFISREVTKEYYHAVFIEHNRQSIFYTDLLDFKMDEYENDEYKQEYKVLKKRSSSPFKIYDLTGLSKEWIPLYKYRNKYYIYYPSDRGNAGRRIISDSTMVYRFMDGVRIEPFMAVKKVDNHTYSFNLRSLFIDTGISQITIHIIDPKNNIVVWEDSSPYSGHFQLFIARENAKNFDMVVNYCKEIKTEEFQFDDIEFASLLKVH